MKMKEKKTEEIVEEVIETDSELVDYLKFARECLYQYHHFEDIAHIGCGYPEDWDYMFESFGVDISKPVHIAIGYNDKDLPHVIDLFINRWIENYNKLDLSKYDNYTLTILDKLTPNPLSVSFLKKHFKKCEQHTMEE